MRRPRWLRGLRVRLVLTFVLVTVLGAVTAVWASYGSTRNSLVAEAQHEATAEVHRQVTEVAPSLALPPGQADLDRLRAAVGGSVLVTFGGLTSRSGEVPPVEEIRAEIRAGDKLVVQRVTGPVLLIGTPVVLTALDGVRKPSGIEVYAARDLGEVQQQVNASAEAAAQSSVLALVVAILLALLAARTVLRPVRKLRGTAQRLADGDLTARLQVRGSDELAGLAVTFNHMAGELHESVTELRRIEADARRFVADVSHELRTPLTTLTAVVEVLDTEAEGMSPNARESAQLALEETRKLTRLVEDLVEVSRFDARVAQLRLEDVEVRQAVEDCLRSRGWEHLVDLDAPDEITARLDRRRLDVLTANLVGNAVRHGAPPVTVRLRAVGELLELTVLDHGSGLPEGTFSQVFERFYKAETARTRSAGSGLGLAIAYENARLHGGDIKAGNAPGGGAEFVARLPIHHAGEDT